MRFWLGGYSADMDGSATGIGVLRAGEIDSASAGGPLAFTGDAVAARSPSWIAAHPTLDVVYAALESTGTVQAYRRTGEETLARLGPAVDAGAAVCHVAVAPDGGSLIASCWGDGQVVRMPLDAAGRPLSAQQAPLPVDPYGPEGEPSSSREAGDLDLAAAARALREAAGDEYAHLVPDHDAALDDAAVPEEASRVPHAHQARFLPGGLVATTDMGFDLVRLWRPTTTGLRAVQQIVLPRGSGPRHMVWHPSGHLYVVTELSGEVFALAADASGTWRVVAGVALGALPGDTAAEIALSRDGEVVYAALRGSNTIATARVRGAGEALEPVALVEAGVDWPRHHLVVRDTLLVAGQRSEEVVSLTLDLRTGVPGRVRHRTVAPAPSCLLPLR